MPERLIKENGIKLMLGPYSSGLIQALLPIVEKHQVPMVEGNGAPRELFTKGYRHIFAVPTTPDQYLADAIELAAENARKLGNEAAAVTVASPSSAPPSSRSSRALRR